MTWDSTAFPAGLVDTLAGIMVERVGRLLEG